MRQISRGSAHSLDNEHAVLRNEVHNVHGIRKRGSDIDKTEGLGGRGGFATSQHLNMIEIKYD